jgi:hypothetical protein
MRRRSTLSLDGKGGYRFVELTLEAPPPQHVPATVFRQGPPRVGEIIYSRKHHRQYLPGMSALRRAMGGGHDPPQAVASARNPPRARIVWVYQITNNFFR